MTIDEAYDRIYEAWVRTKDEDLDTALTVLANIELLIK